MPGLALLSRAESLVSTIACLTFEQYIWKNPVLTTIRCDCDATASMTNQTARLAIYFERGVVAVGHLYGVVRDVPLPKKAVVVGGSFFGSRSQLYVIPPSPPLDQLPQDGIQ